MSIKDVKVQVGSGKEYKKYWLAKNFIDLFFKFCNFSMRSKVIIRNNKKNSIIYIKMFYIFKSVNNYKKVYN